MRLISFVVRAELKPGSSLLSDDEQSSRREPRFRAEILKKTLSTQERAWDRCFVERWGRRRTLEERNNQQRDSDPPTTHDKGAKSLFLSGKAFRRPKPLKKGTFQEKRIHIFFWEVDRDSPQKALDRSTNAAMERDHELEHDGLVTLQESTLSL